jgi:hypothetical protein
MGMTGIRRCIDDGDAELGAGTAWYESNWSPRQLSHLATATARLEQDIYLLGKLQCTKLTSYIEAICNKASVIFTLGPTTGNSIVRKYVGHRVRNE